MNGHHFTIEELLDRLYGIGRQDDHLDSCPECRVRWEALQERRARLLEEPVVDPALLARQRAAIFERIERPRVFHPRPAPAFALALLVLLAVALTRPALQHTPQVARVSDAQIFAEAYALLQEDVPRAGRPIQELFEEQR